MSFKLIKEDVETVWDGWQNCILFIPGVCLLMDENTRDILRNNYWLSADVMAAMLMHVSKRLVFLCWELNSFFLLILRKKKFFFPPAWVPYHVVENQ